MIKTYQIIKESVFIEGVNVDKYNIYYYTNNNLDLVEFHSLDGVNGEIRQEYNKPKTETATERKTKAPEPEPIKTEPIQTIQIEETMQQHENTNVTKPTIINKQPFYNSPKFNLYKIDFIRAFLFTSLASAFFYAKKYIAFEVDLLPYFFVVVYFTHILINFFKSNDQK